MHSPAASCTTASREQSAIRPVYVFEANAEHYARRER